MSNRYQRDQSEFSKLDQRTHVYERPAMYIGSDEPQERETYIYDREKKVMKLTTITLVPALERIFLELLANCADNVGESRRSNIDPGVIEITLSPTTITLRNSGLAMDTSIHAKEGIPVPELVFGNLLAGSNFKVERHDAGVNGIGAKAANIMSKRFEVTIDNAHQRTTYHQVWTENMLKRSDSVLSKYKGSSSFVTISYLADFERFGYTEYPEEAISLFYRHILDVSFNNQVPVKINGVEYNYSNIIEYGALYFDLGKEYGVYEKGNVRLLFLGSEESRQVSFVNCVQTSDGGTHVKEALRAISVPLIKEVGKRTDLSSKLTTKDIASRISLLISVKITNPAFTSQTKTQLNSKISFSLTSELEEKMRGWELVTELVHDLEAKDLRRMKKTDGTSRKHVKLLKGVDANNAGTTKRASTVLIVSEGKSGLSYGSAVCKLTPNGKDTYGLLPMKGKNLNAFTNSSIKLEANPEYIEFKKMLGLKSGVDYGIPENRKTLRYGSLLIMTDADVDGKHISGLILVYLHVNFPTLLSSGFVSQFRTPVLRAVKNKEKIPFYFESDYERWVVTDPSHKSYKVEYYKGLASSGDDDILDDLERNKKVLFLTDPQYVETLRLAFDGSQTNMRKDWIVNYRDTIIPDLPTQSITDFVNKEVILFAIDNLHRSIPRMDGLKESQRKVIYSTLLNPRWTISPGKVVGTKYKIEQFKGNVADVASYHHGEAILENVIRRMTEGWIGTNNLPWFKPMDQLGTYEKGGKDGGAARYVHVMPQIYLGSVLRSEDLPITPLQVLEGETIEPVRYHPIIPMVLVNGARGIGSGWATYIPNHRVEDVIQGIRDRMAGTTPTPLIPFYEGYTGKISIERMGKYIALDPNENDDIDEEIEWLDMEASGYSMISKGTYEIKKGQVHITALPLGVYPSDYRLLLDSWVEKKLIKDYRDLSAGNRVSFYLEGVNFTPTYKTLKLLGRQSLSSMVVLGDNDRPIRYETADELMDDWYTQRLAKYVERWEYEKNIKLEAIETAKTKTRFIQAVVKGEIQVLGRRVEEIYIDLEKVGIPIEMARDFLKTIKILSLTEEKMEKGLEKIKELEDDLKGFLSRTPKDLWESDLKDLEKAVTKYKKWYEEKTNSPLKTM